MVHVSCVSKIMTSHTTYKFSDFSHIESRTWRRSMMCPGLPVSKFAGSVCYLEQGWARFDQLFISLKILNTRRTVFTLSFVSMYNFKWIQCSSNRKTRKYNDTLNENELNIYCLFEDCSKQWIISSECYVPQTVNQKLQRYAEWYELNIHYLLKTVAK